MSEQPQIKRLTIRLEFIVDDDTNPDFPRAVTDTVAILAALADAGFDGGEIEVADGPVRKKP